MSEKNVSEGANEGNTHPRSAAKSKVNRTWAWLEKSSAHDDRIGPVVAYMKDEISRGKNIPHPFRSKAAMVAYLKWSGAGPKVTDAVDAAWWHYRKFVERRRTVRVVR